MNFFKFGQHKLTFISFLWILILILQVLIIKSTYAEELTISNENNLEKTSKDLDKDLLSSIKTEEVDTPKEILNAEESSVKEIKVQLSTESSFVNSTSELIKENKPEVLLKTDEVKKDNSTEKTKEKEVLTNASSNVVIKIEDESKLKDEKKIETNLDQKETIDNKKVKIDSTDTTELNIEESIKNENKHEGYKLVCYYANWAIYRPGLAKFTPQNINPKLCTHIIYAFGGLSSKYEMKAFDPYNDINQGNYKKFTGLKVYNKNLKTMIAIGGWNEGSKRFSKLVADPSLRKTFVDSVVKFLRQHQFDGLDLDWEYPAFRDGSSEDDKENYAELIQELREAFEKESKETGKERLLLTIAVPAGQDYIDNGFNVPKIVKNVDFMNLLSYDYYTSYDPETGHHSPLSAQNGLSSFDDGKKLNVEWTVNYYIEKGAPRSKIIVGMPTYGRSYTLTDPTNNGLKATAEGPGEQGLATREKGYLAYFEICQKIKEEKWAVKYSDPKNVGPHAFLDKQWVGYDDIDTFKKKADFVIQNNLGGAMVWTLDNDDFRGLCTGQQSPLITTLKEALANASSTAKPEINSNVIQPSSSLDKPVRAISRPETTRKQINSRRPTFGYSGTSSTAASTTSTTSTTTTTTTTTTTPEPSTEVSEPEFTTPDPGVEFKCEDEGFFKNPKDCKKYFWCLDSGPANLGIVAHTFTCPQGLFFNPQTEACDYPANVQGCKSEKKNSNKKKKKTSKTTTTEAPESSTTRSTTTQRSTPLRRRTTTTSTTTTTTTPKPTTEASFKNDITPPSGVNGQITPELLAAALKLAREQEQSTTANSGPSNDHLFQLLQLVKSLGGVDKVQELLNSYNYNKQPINNNSVNTNPILPTDFTSNSVDKLANTEVHNHRIHVDNNIHENNPNNNLNIVPSNGFSSTRQNSRSLSRQTTNSPFLNPSYVTPRRVPDVMITESPIALDYSNQPLDNNQFLPNNNLLDLSRNTNNDTPFRQRRPQRVEVTTENSIIDVTTSKTKSPFNFFYNEPIMRNNPIINPNPNIDGDIILPTEQPNIISNAPRGRQTPQRTRTAVTSVIVNPTSDFREPTNVDGFFLYNNPTRERSSRQPTSSVITPERVQNNPSNSRRIHNRPKPENSGNSYSVPASVVSLKRENLRNSETKPSSSSASTRKRKPARVRIQTGFVVAETPSSPGVTYDEEADIIIPFINRNLETTNTKPMKNRRKNESNNQNSFTHHHNHNINENRIKMNPFDIPSMNLNDQTLPPPPEPTLIFRKPPSVRRRPPQRSHILNNLDQNIIKPYHEDVPKIEKIEENLPRNQINKQTTNNPFSNYGLPSIIPENEPSSITPDIAIDQPSSSVQPNIPSIVEDLERNYNIETDIFNYGNSLSVNQPSTNLVEKIKIDFNTTPAVSSLKTESIPVSTVTESIAVSSVQTTTETSVVSTQKPTTNNSLRGNGRRSRPRTNNNSRNTETTPQSVQPKITSKPRVSTPIIKPAVVVTPAPVSNSNVPSGSSSNEAITWDQVTNKVTCNRRGVHPHPQSCGQFVVCAPSKSGIKAYPHHCPAQQVFVKEVGRCKPGNREKCEAFLKA